MDSAETVKEISGSDLDAAIKRESLVACDFYATWCGPCKMLAPKLHELAKEYPNVTFVKIDIDKNEETMEKHRVSAVPTVVVFKNEVEFERYTGAEIDRVEQILKKLC